VPRFEFPRQIPPTVHFVGTPPIIPGQAQLPPWAHELDGTRKVAGRPRAVNRMTAGIGSIVVRQRLPEYAGSNSSAHIHVEGMARPSFKVEERNYSSDAPGRREDRYCVGDIPKEALNNRLKWAESL
jgi:hypothetical protein